jgi:Gram-negative bacterial TonB protein C-terminal
MKKKALFLLFPCAVLCFASQLFCEDNAAPDARSLLRSAHEVSGLVEAMPYQFRGTVVFNPGPGEVKGQITIYRDKDRSRLDLQMGSYRESRLVLGNKLFIVRSTAFPAPGMSRLTDADRAWDRLVQDGDATLSGVSHKKIQNTQADCFEVKGEQHHRLCFDSSRRVLLENQDEVQSVQFSDYQPVAEAHQFYPRKILVLAELERSEKPLFVVEDIAVQKAELPPSTFALPENPLELETCENMQPAKLLESVRPQLQRSVMARNSGVQGVYGYGIVDKDGRLQNVKVLTADNDLQEALVEALKQRKYAPAMCGSNPVASEQVIQIPLMGAERGRR